jgi:DNA mismatch repair protein MutL
MGRIVILDENTVNKIAAGEVIERPSSVVKELIENSIDAGASSINIEIRSGGISYIKVIDNGSGIEEDDVEIAFESHATSKIRNVNDLDSVKSMGFRGEALSSIAAVSAVILLSRTASVPSGLMVEVRGGNVLDVKSAGCPIGTSITVKDLFFNTPARFKFLKKDTAEAGSISEIISREALGNPKISSHSRQWRFA